MVGDGVARRCVKSNIDDWLCSTCAYSEGVEDGCMAA